MTSLSFIFPRDVMQPSLPDAHFQSEADAARSLGCHVALVDHDAIVAGDIATGIRGLHDVPGDSIYRGWMIPPHRYAEMETALVGSGLTLRTSAASFSKAHHLPNWFDTMRELAPFSVWTTSNSLTDFETALAELPAGAAVLKDYSKSEKHCWEEAMFIPDVGNIATPALSPHDSSNYVVTPSIAASSCGPSKKSNQSRREPGGSTEPAFALRHIPIRQTTNSTASM